MIPPLLTIHNLCGYLHPETKLFTAPVQLEHCVLRWTDSTGEVRDYFITSMEELHRMALYILDAMALNLHTPVTVDDFDQLREHWMGWFSPAPHDDVVHDIAYEQFQAIRRARHGPMAWWWLQRNLRIAEGNTWNFQFVAPWKSANPLPVPTAPPPTPIKWLNLP
jgi:hypothetical protein